MGPGLRDRYNEIVRRYDEMATENARLRQQIHLVKAELAAGANFGAVVEILFYQPLREAEAELTRLRELLSGFRSST